MRAKLSLSILLISAALIAYGIYTKQWQQIYDNARRLCLACIGIGGW